MTDPNAYRQASLLASLAQRWLSWRDRTCAAAPTQQGPTAPRGNESAEIGQGRSARRAWPGKWPNSADLLTRRMASLDIDPVAIRSTLPELAREAERACALCLDKTDCRHDLDRGGTNASWADRCPNADLLLAVRATHGVKP